MILIGKIGMTLETGKENMEKDYIGVNIWDDYHDDGHVPDGEIQKTYAYVEDSSLSHDESKIILEALKLKIKTILGINSSPIMTLIFDESKEYYKWRLYIKPLTHEKRKHIVEELKSWGYTHNSKPVEVYSES